MHGSKKVVIAGYVRSPFTPAIKGALKDVRPDDLMAQTVQGLIRKTGVNPDLIEDLKVGCAFPEAEQGYNIARQVVLIAGLSQDVPGVTTNRYCGSSMQAVHDAAGMIATGMADAVIAAGVESMTRVPMGGFNPSPNVKLYKELPAAYMSMGETAEIVADRFKISREDQEKFSLSSQFKTAAAKKAGKFDDTIVPIVKTDGSVVTEDGCARPNTTLEGLAALKPAFKRDGTITAGTSSPLTDGASAVLVCSEEFALKHGLTIMAEIESFAVTGCDPEIMGTGPVSATKKALAKAGLELKDIDIVELHEAFAAQSLACVKELGLDLEKVNKDGGAIAIGHPLGASGTRITGEAARILKEEGKEYALATMCIGVGQGIATILKKPSAQPKI
jgi:acetyl-CoA acyltransferase